MVVKYPEICYKEKNLCLCFLYLFQVVIHTFSKDFYTELIVTDCKNHSFTTNLHECQL